MMTLSDRHRRWLLLAFSAAAFLPVFFFSPQRGESPPPFAFPQYVTDKVDPNVIPNAIDRVRILIHRDYRSDRSLWYLGFLVWLPLGVGLFSALLFELTHHEIQRYYSLEVAAAAIAAAITVAMLWKWQYLALAMVAASAVAVGLRVRHCFRNRSVPLPFGWSRGGRCHLFVAAVLAVSGAVLSTSTHLLLTRYDGYAPSTDRFTELAADFDEFMEVDAPPYVRDDAAWRIAQLPSISAVGWRMTLFGLNKAAAIVFVVMALAYALVWAIVIHHHHRKRNWICEQCSTSNLAECSRCECLQPRGLSTLRAIRLAFSAAVYLATGVGFAVIFYNEYASAAAKQNVMAAYADYLTADGKRVQVLEAYFRKYRWSQSIEQEILSVTRHRPADAIALAGSIAKARARFWPSAVIAHETPRVREIDSPSPRHDIAQAPPRVETEFAVDPIMSFHDMAYFSFVTFTTTGYGDVRPVSDDLRFWTIIENITEILFVAFLIGTAVVDD